MKTLILTLLMLLPGCSAHISITQTAPDGTMTEVTVDSARRTAISTAGVTVITGQVLIDDETVRALAPSVVGAINPVDVN
jgi:hypothetical protein